MKIYNNVEAFNNAFANNKKAVVGFFMNGCGHCVAFKPEWDKFKKKAESMGGGAIIGEIQQHGMDKAKCDTSNFQGFPTVRFYDGKGGFKDHEGPRTSDALIEKTNELNSIQTGGKKSGRKKNNKTHRKKSYIKKARRTRGRRGVTAKRGRRGVPAKRGRRGVPAKRGRRGVTAKRGRRGVTAKRGRRGVPAGRKKSRKSNIKKARGTKSRRSVSARKSFSNIVNRFIKTLKCNKC